MPCSGQARWPSVAQTRRRVPKSISEADFQVLGEAEGIIDRVRSGLELRATGAVSSRRAKFKVDVAQEPDTEIRSPRLRALSLPRRPILARLSFQLRILRHHRALRPGAARPRPTSRCLAELRRACLDRGSRARRFRRRQLHRQQEEQSRSSCPIRLTGNSARPSLHVLDRSVDQPGRGRAASKDDAPGEFLRHLRRHRESGYRNADIQCRRSRTPGAASPTASQAIYAARNDRAWPVSSSASIRRSAVYHVAWLKRSRRCRFQCVWSDCCTHCRIPSSPDGYSAKAAIYRL